MPPSLPIVFIPIDPERWEFMGFNTQHNCHQNQDTPTVVCRWPLHLLQNRNNLCGSRSQDIPTEGTLDCQIQWAFEVLWSWRHQWTLLLTYHDFYRSGVLHTKTKHDKHYLIEKDHVDISFWYNNWTLSIGYGNVV